MSKEFYLILILFLTLSLPVFSQKNHQYFDESNNPITKSEYIKIDEFQGLIKLDFDLDSVYHHTVERREVWGKIPIDSLGKIRFYIYKLTKNAIPMLHTIVINYIHSDDGCYKSGNLKFQIQGYEWYKKELDKYKNVSQVNMFLIDGVDQFENQIPYVQDQEKKISAFFNHQHYHCGSFIIFYPDGKFYLFKGEYMPEQILDRL